VASDTVHIRREGSWINQRGLAEEASRVIGGDTLALETGEDVRLIGVDTPETKHPKKPVQRFGKEATAFTKRRVEGKEVRLGYDQQRKDKYDRAGLCLLGGWHVPECRDHLPGIWVCLYPVSLSVPGRIPAAGT
jgi:hypothetical protein